jgi:hypothetical protein
MGETQKSFASKTLMSWSRVKVGVLIVRSKVRMVEGSKGMGTGRGEGEGGGSGSRVG